MPCTSPNVLFLVSSNVDLKGNGAMQKLCTTLFWQQPLTLILLSSQELTRKYQCCPVNVDHTVVPPRRDVSVPILRQLHFKGSELK
jgi:hypothetical protein